MGKILVVSIDKDDDIGKKIGVKGPIIGEKQNIEIAKELLLADPGESDGNTIFEAVKIFRENKEVTDVVTLTGHKTRGPKADKAVRKQFEAVLQKYPDVEGIYLVTDGADDDDLIPVIQSHVKILSKKTCIVKQARQLEKDYYVLKEVLRDPHFARIIFGLPGIILLTWALFQDLGIKIVVMLIGFYLVLKGFNVEESIINWFKDFKNTTSTERASFPLYLGSILTFILSIVSGYETIMLSPQNWIMQISYFVEGFITLFLVSIILFMLGRMGDFYYRKEVLKIKKYALSFIALFSFWLVISKAVALIIGKILLDEFIAFVLIAFFGTIVGLAAVKIIYTSVYITKKLNKGMDVYDRYGLKIGKIESVNTKKNFIQVSGREKLAYRFSKILIAKPNENFIVVWT